MSDFKVGDRVLCIKTHSSPKCPLILGREYIVYDFLNLSCGCKGIDVGAIIPTGSKGVHCKHYDLISAGRAWFLGVELFVKKEERVNYVKLEVEIEEPIYN